MLILRKSIEKLKKNTKEASGWLGSEVHSILTQHMIIEGQAILLHKNDKNLSKIIEAT